MFCTIFFLSITVLLYILSYILLKHLKVYNLYRYFDNLNYLTCANVTCNKNKRDRLMRFVAIQLAYWKQHYEII